MDVCKTGMAFHRATTVLMVAQMVTIPATPMMLTHFHNADFSLDPFAIYASLSSLL